MNMAYIKRLIKTIEAKKDDSEMAHGMEDALHEKFIRYVADNGNQKLSAMAKEILKTDKIPFGRWCA